MARQSEPPRTIEGAASHARIVDAAIQRLAECGCSAATIDALSSRSSVDLDPIFADVREHLLLLLQHRAAAPGPRAIR